MALRKLCAILLLLFPGAVAAYANAEEAPLMKLDADLIEYQADTRSASASGNARLEYADMRMTAASIAFDHDSGLVRAAGGVRLFWEGRTLQGISLEYNIGRGEAVLNNGRGAAEKIFFSGERLEASRALIRIINGSFSTCSQERPHYRLTAKSISYFSGSRVEVRSVSLWLGKYRIFYLPLLKWDLAKDKQNVLPMVSYDSYYGLHLNTDYAFPADRDTIFVANLKVGHRTGAAFNLNRQEKGYDLSLMLDWDRLSPEQPDYRISHLPYLSIASHDADIGPVRVRGGLDYGRIREMPTNLLATRSALWARVTDSDLLRLPKGRIELFAEGRDSWYSTGSSYASFGAGLNIERIIGSNSKVSLGYARYNVSGSTPFQFDRLQVPYRLDGAIEGDIGRNWNVAAGLTYDLSSGKVWDTELALGRYLHCIEIRATWRQRSNAFGLEFNLINL